MAKYHDRLNWKKEARLLPGYIIVGLWVAFTAIMLIWIIAASLSTTKEIMTGKVFDFSKGVNWKNYVTAWKTQNVSLYFVNSLIYSIIACSGVLLISAPGAYVLSRWDFVGSKFTRIGLVVAMSVPTIMIILPLYSLAVQWGIKGRVLLVVLYIMLRVPYTTIYLLDFFSTLSKSYEEAAYLDGCSHAGTFWKIMLPLAQSGIITVTVFNFLNVWNEYFMALIFASGQDVRPVAVGLWSMINSMRYTGDWSGLFASVILVFLPTFVLYVTMSNRIISGITQGGVKG